MGALLGGWSGDIEGARWRGRNLLLPIMSTIGVAATLGGRGDR